MTLIVAVDTETTGLNPKTDRVIEVGAVLWEVESKRPMALLSEFVQTTLTINPEAQKVNHISEADLETYGMSPVLAFGSLKSMIERADYIMGHNINKFDIPFLKEEFRRSDYEWPNKPVLDTLTDIKYTHGDLSRKLSHLAGAHGIINPFPHRAVFDALTCLKIAAMYSFEDMINRLKSPTKTIRAIISYDHRQMVKDAGFTWTGSSWVKDIKECDNETYPFPTTPV